MRSSLFLLGFYFVVQIAPAQVIPAGFPVFEELLRRKQLLGEEGKPHSFMLRSGIQDESVYEASSYLDGKVPDLEIGILPMLSSIRGTSNRPYGSGDYGMIPNPGLQTYFSGGGYVTYKGFNLTFRPELVIAQNLGFDSDIGSMSTFEIKSRFLLWNIGDVPERFGNKTYVRPWWGQSKLTYQYGAFEVGVSSQNIWWGPGQWNSLTFSNNAQGFPHVTLNSTKPAKTFLGTFEGQMVVGRLLNSGFGPSQDEKLNKLYFLPFTGDWRYLNAILISWSLKWVDGLHLGFSRTHHQYNAMRGNTFYDWFPIFEGFQKKNLFRDGTSDDYDSNGRSQSFTLFGRWLFKKTKSEMYFEYGRRDHPFNWREFAINPEHARAYILGFNQLIKISDWKSHLQIRSEITHQQESVNRYIRNRGISGGSTWHTHGTARGFVNRGQPLGVGIGTGSNVQTLELALVDGVNKKGILFERLANNQDFYYKALLQFTDRKPWIDYSLGVLYDRQFENLLVSSKLQVIHARNYQWQLDPLSTPEFPKGRNLTSVMAQVSAIYFW
jgi:hypothetical protein